MIFPYVIQLLRQRSKSKNDEPEPDEHNYDTPQTYPEGAAENSAYQELDFLNSDPENIYQALRMNTRGRIDNETKIEDEDHYEKLNEVREKESNYQCLNPV